MKPAEYVKKRKKFLKEMKELVYERATINKQIRSAQREMNAVDNYLLEEK